MDLEECLLIAEAYREEKGRFALESKHGPSDGLGLRYARYGVAIMKYGVDMMKYGFLKIRYKEAAVATNRSGGVRGLFQMLLLNAVITNGRKENED
ncbi:hypothetical protein Tco_1467439 [Tanacetum coccineum]